MGLLCGCPMSSEIYTEMQHWFLVGEGQSASVANWDNWGRNVNGFTGGIVTGIVTAVREHRNSSPPSASKQRRFSAVRIFLFLSCLPSSSSSHEASSSNRANKQDKYHKCGFSFLPLIMLNGSVIEYSSDCSSDFCCPCMFGFDALFQYHLQF